MTNKTGEHRMESARLLARLKLQVRRKLDQPVDLARLLADGTYAEARLRELEEAADDEELLVLILMTRERLLPVRAERKSAEAAKAPVADPPLARDYRYGARGG
jgi:hypothetical protein